jgi:catechol 2,3-dioxygenase-like lactoylglutathione lyase family enzyme
MRRLFPENRSWEPHEQAHTAIDLLALDHVALSVPDPGALARFLCDHLGLREVGSSRDGTVVGAGEGGTTLRLSAADGPRDPGPLGRLVFRVADLHDAIASLPEGTIVEGDGFETANFTGPDGVGLGFTFFAGGGVDRDLDHLLLRVTDPEETRMAFAEVGCVPRGQTLHVADKGIALEGGPSPTDRPLLHHIAVRVASIEAIAEQARRRGLEADELAEGDAFGIILPGPERVRLTFVEQPAVH